MLQPLTAQAAVSYWLSLLPSSLARPKVLYPLLGGASLGRGGLEGCRGGWLLAFDGYCYCSSPARTYQNWRDEMLHASKSGTVRLCLCTLKNQSRRVHNCPSSQLSPRILSWLLIIRPG
jgi:hypothetical protein